MNEPETRAASGRIRSLVATALNVGLMFAAAACAGLGILVALFWLGVAAGIDIMFYRGLVLCAVAFAVTAILFGWLGPE